MTEIELEFINSLEEVEEVYGIPVGDDVTMFKGVAITKGITMNNRIYTVEVLKEIASQLSGLPIMYGTKFTADGLVHDKDTAKAVGQVVDAWFNPQKKRVEFIGKVMNTVEVPDIRQKIKEGIIRFFSIGGKGTLEEMGEYRKVKDIILTHLSLVAIPGDPNAKLIDIIQENYTCFNNVCIPYYGCTRISQKTREAEKRILRIAKKID